MEIKSTNINQTNNNINSLINKKVMLYDVGDLGQELETNQLCFIL